MLVVSDGCLGSGYSLGATTLTYHRAAQHDDLMPVATNGLSEREDVLGQANTVHGVSDMLEVCTGCFCCKAYFLNGLAVAGVLTRPVRRHDENLLFN